MTGWMPHGQCVRWDKGVLVTEIISNMTIAISYYLIPLALLRGRRSLMKVKLARLFAAFIALCGTTHLMQIVTVFQAQYWLAAGVSLSTAIVSAMVAINLYLYADELVPPDPPKETRNDGGS